MSYTIGPKSLRKVCPSLSARRADALARELGEAMHRFGITEPHACAHFVAQCAHESGEFRWTRELWGPTFVQRGYWLRRELQGTGPLYPGIGFLYRGAGWIQTTGRNHFRSAAKELGCRLATLCARAGSEKYASLMAAIWWSQHFPHSMAGFDVETVTRRVNGGFNGLAERRKYYSRAIEVARYLTPRRAS